MAHGEGRMKIVLYDDYKAGLLKDGNVVDVSGVVSRGATPPASPPIHASSSITG